METLLQDINHGFLYTHRGQLQTEICQVHDETDNDLRHKMRQTINKDNRMEFCYTIFMYIGSLLIAYLQSLLLQSSCKSSQPWQSFCKSSQPCPTSPVILQELPVLLYLTSHSARVPALSYLTSHSTRAPSLALPHQSFCKGSQSCSTSPCSHSASPDLPHQSFCKSSQPYSTSPVILQELPVLPYLTSHSARAPSLALPHQSFCKPRPTSPVILQELPALSYLTSHSARASSLALPHQSFCKSSQSCQSFCKSSQSCQSFCKSSQPCSTSPVILQELPALSYLISHSTRATVQLQLRMLSCPGVQERGGSLDA